MTREEAIAELNVLHERLSNPKDCEDGCYSWEDGWYVEAIDMAIEALTNVQNMHKAERWIPCSERLPSEKDGHVLVTKHDEVRIAKYSEFSGRWYLGDMYAVSGENPIAWMPLPEPYKGGDSE